MSQMEGSLKEVRITTQIIEVKKGYSGKEGIKGKTEKEKRTQIMNKSRKNRKRKGLEIFITEEEEKLINGKEELEEVQEELEGYKIQLMVSLEEELE